MPDNNPKKIKINCNVNFFNENRSYTGEIDSATFIPTNIITDENFETELNLKGINIDDLANVYNNGNNSTAVFNYLLQYIENNKNNPELLISSLSNLLENEVNHYDSNHNRSGIDGSPDEILEKFINAKENEKIEGAICGPIHQLIMTALEKCNIPSSLIYCAEQNSNGHVTLIYKLDDGKYVFNNYGKNIIINNAQTIEDAIAQIHKKGSNIDILGYYQIADGKISYQKYAAVKDAAFGNRFDKVNYENETVCADNILNDSTLSTNFSVSNIGNIVFNTELSLVNNIENTKSEKIYKAEIRKSNNTELFSKSHSFGLGFELNKVKSDKNNKKYFGFQAFSSYINGTTDSTDYQIREDYRNYISDIVSNRLEVTNSDSGSKVSTTVRSVPSLESTNDAVKCSYLSNLIRCKMGIESKICENENSKLLNTLQGSLLTGITINGSHLAGDFRSLLEDKIELQSFGRNHFMTNSVTLGAISDLNLSHESPFVSFQPGYKLGTNHQVNYKVDNNLNIGAKIDGYVVKNQVSTNTGIGGQLYTQYTPKNQKISFFGNVGLNYKKRHLNLGLWNQDLEKNTTFSTTVGINKGKTSIALNYTKSSDIVNPNRNSNNIMATLSIRP